MYWIGSLPRSIQEVRTRGTQGYLPRVYGRKTQSDFPGSRSTKVRCHHLYTESIAAAVVAAVTEAKSTKPATPLSEGIDPDALKDLYQYGSTEVSFEYLGYHVTVHSDRTISVIHIDSKAATGISRSQETGDDIVLFTVVPLRERSLVSDIREHH
jgi:hypothetical protein